MREDNERLEDIHIESPCDASWESMQGDEQKRHCELCDLHVHNLAALPREEGEALLAKRKAGERVCVRVELRPDGSCVTSDDAQEEKRPGLMTAAAFVVGASLTAACYTEEEQSSELMPKVEESQADPEPTLEENLRMLGGLGYADCEEDEAQECEGDSSEAAPECDAQSSTPGKPQVIMGTPGPPKQR